MSMRVYLVVPTQSNALTLFEESRNLFVRNESLFIYSSFSENCIQCAIKIADGAKKLLLSVDVRLSSIDPKNFEEFCTYHYWPNHFTNILVVEKVVAEMIREQLDPENTEVIPIDTFFCLKNVPVPEHLDDENQEVE